MSTMEPFSIYRGPGLGEQNFRGAGLPLGAALDKRSPIYVAAIQAKYEIGPAGTKIAYATFHQEVTSNFGNASKVDFYTWHLQAFHQFESY